jgi:hypothetical protein
MKEREGERKEAVRARGNYSNVIVTRGSFSSCVATWRNTTVRSIRVNTTSRALRRVTPDAHLTAQADHLAHQARTSPSSEHEGSPQSEIQFPKPAPIDINIRR